ncbi:MAG: hypothetical protein ACI4WS_06115 [Oscillospiraceae bacterium]
MPSNQKDSRSTYFPTPALNSSTLRDIGYTADDLYPVDISKAADLRSKGVSIYHIYFNKANKENGVLKPQCQYGVRKSEWDRVIAKNFASAPAWEANDVKNNGAIIIYRQNTGGMPLYDPSELAASNTLNRNNYDIIDVFKVSLSEPDIQSTVLAAVTERRRFSFEPHNCMQIGDVAAVFDIDGNQTAAYILGYQGLEKLQEFEQKIIKENRLTKHGIIGYDKLKTIEIDKYESDPDNPDLCRKTGQITYQEVFDQLKDHLEYLGMLPDKYFEISPCICQPGNPIPENWCEFNSLAVYGSVEGIYLDIYLKTSDGITKFADGKTNDSSTESFFWISRIAAECNLMLNGNGLEIFLPHDIQDILEQKARDEDEQLNYEDTDESDELSM